MGMFSLKRRLNAWCCVSEGCCIRVHFWLLLFARQPHGLNLDCDFGAWYHVGLQDMVKDGL